MNLLLQYANLQNVAQQKKHSYILKFQLIMLTVFAAKWTEAEHSASSIDTTGGAMTQQQKTTMPTHSN